MPTTSRSGRFSHIISPDLGEHAKELVVAALEVSFTESAARNHRETPQRGRTPVQPTPDIDPSPAWTDAWDGSELHELSKGRRPHTTRNRKCVVMIMARHLTAQGITDPGALTKAQLNRYLLAQYQDRKPGGRLALYQAVKVFFDWLAAEYEVPNPIAGIPRPKGGSEPVPVVQPDQI